MARMRKQWGVFRSGLIAIAAGSLSRVSLVSILEGDMSSLSNYTIIRTVGIMSLVPLTTTPPQAGLGFIGLSASSSVATTPAPASVQADWLWRTATWVPATGNNPNFKEISFDIRAMRKQSELDRDYFFVAQEFGGVQGYSIFIGGQVLVGLP